MNREMKTLKRTNAEELGMLKEENARVRQRLDATERINTELRNLEGSNVRVSKRETHHSTIHSMQPSESQKALMGRL